MKVPGSKDNIISECSFCDSFAWKQSGTCKCSLHPKEIPEDKLKKSYLGLPENDIGYFQLLWAMGRGPPYLKEIPIN